MKILFVCTHNACRSILAEAITRKMANNRLQAASAGSEPAGRVHPLTLKHLKRRGYGTDNLSSKSWEVAVGDSCPTIAITVCDQAAGEACPVSPGEAIKGHWGLMDPSHPLTGSIDEESAFDQVIDTIAGRIQLLLNEPIETMDNAQLQALIDRIGQC